MTDEAPRTYRVKRYANRKLYDTVARRFTSLSEIEALVRSGVDVRVAEHESGTDLTADTLVQVLGASVRSGGESLSSLLSTLIRNPGRISQALSDDDHQAGELRKLRHQVEMLTRTVAALLADGGGAPAQRSTSDDR